MDADFTIVQGDTAPSFADTLTYSNDEPVNLEGATVKLVMRALTASEPVVLTGETTITAPDAGGILFTPTAADSSVVGDYMGNWVVTFADGTRMTFPTVGYLWIKVAENLTTQGGAQLLGLPEVKDYLNIEKDDRVHDTKLLGHIHAVRPLIEAEIGPVLPTVFDEWFNGGHATIALSHRPNTGFGTNPILRLLAASEYRGPVEYDLAIIQTPSEGQVYSVMLDPIHGTVTRRTAGGGVIPFPFDPERGDQQVHLVYEAGQEQVPENVKMAAKEAIRVNYRSTQSVGKGKRASTDEEPGPAVPFYLPRKALELLAPNRRFPSIA